MGSFPDQKWVHYNAVTRWKCQACQELFPSVHDVVDHIREKHSAEPYEAGE